MPRTTDYLCPFDGVINRAPQADGDGPSRRSVMAAGSALAVVASTAMLSPAGAAGAEDWPEFAEWLRLALAISASTSDTWEEPEYEAILNRFYALEDEMFQRVAVSERHISMLVAVYVWHECAKAFDLTTGVYCSNQHDAMINALVARAAVVLPEVPFVPLDEEEA